ncbi:hypothetical protein [Brevundimonas subvibrioides]|uniref:hypothetical protein n=1 Tax=Brevundimonas subvibrioides TaxID=74313 RepID=UPI0022B2C835|nr:hypothetical protein [Brevundimonas subvibrioides]
MKSDRALILDANLAVLLIVGLVDSRLITSHRNLSAYDVDDFELVKSVVAMSTELIWCPHLLSEVSSLIRQIGGPARRQVTAGLSQAISGAKETCLASETALSHPAYASLGLTDAILLLLAQSGATLLTADLDLHLAALADGLSSINFAEVRDERPDFGI